MPLKTGRLQFGDFVLDEDQRILLRQGSEVPLPPKAFLLLTALVQNRERIVEKETLIEKIWGGTFVEEGNLPYTARLLRKALGDDPEHPKYIQTVPRRGYRFIADVIEPVKDDAPVLASGCALVNDTLSQTNGHGPNLGPIELYSRSSAKTPRYILFTTAAAILVFVGGLAFYPWKTSSNSNRSELRIFNNPVITKLTSGAARKTAISSDGKQVAYVLEGENGNSLWIRRIGVESSVRITPPTPDRYFGVVFGPGDDSLIYVTAAPGEFEGKVYSIPVYGGIPRKLLDAVTGQIGLSHDGTKISFIRCRAESEGIIRLMVASIDGTHEREIHEETGQGTMDLTAPPAWSPDDSQIAVLKSSTTDLAGRFIAVNVENGTSEDISRREWTYLDGADWTKEGLIVAARNNSEANLQLWQIISKDQPPRKLVNDLNDYSVVSIPRDDRSLATVQNVTLSQLWSVALDDPRDFRTITHGSSIYRDVSFTPQGKLLYSTISSGSDQIWQTDLEDKNRLSLTEGSRDNFSPVASPDGRFIYFISHRGPNESVYRALADGSDAVKLTTEDETEAEPDVSPDGSAVVYRNALPGSSPLKRVSSGGGAPVLLNARWNASPTISPDGKFVAVWHADKFADDWKLALIDVKNGGDPVKTFAAPSATGRIRWTADGTALLYVSTVGGVSNIWRQPLNGDRPTKVTRFENDLIFSFDISPDGKSLVCERGTTAFDVILLSDGTTE